jgi:hypothetical protein
VKAVRSWFTDVHVSATDPARDEQRAVTKVSCANLSRATMSCTSSPSFLGSILTRQCIHCSGLPDGLLLIVSRRCLWQPMASTSNEKCMVIGIPILPSQSLHRVTLMFLLVIFGEEPLFILKAGV